MSSNIQIRFHDQLNDFLQPELRGSSLSHELTSNRSVKDLLESMGVPHTEIDLIIVNGQSTGFDYLVQKADSIEVFPRLSAHEIERLQLPAVQHCQPEPPTPARFVLDVHLGKLAAYLRMMGFDTLYRNDYADPTLEAISAREKRILLTCDLQLLMRKQVEYGYFVRARLPKKQLVEVISQYSLFDKQKPFSRCMHCNGETQAVDKATIESQLPEKTSQYYNEFFQCQQCGKIYWKGSHYLKMQRLIEQVNANNVAPAS